MMRPLGVLHHLVAIVDGVFTGIQHTPARHYPIFVAIVPNHRGFGLATVRISLQNSGGGNTGRYSQRALLQK